MSTPRTGGAGGTERAAAFELRDALGSSLDIAVVLARAYPALLRLVDADAAALGVSPPGHPEGFEWLVADLPSAFFAAYAELAPHDFVRDAVTRRPNVVLRDGDMLSRRDLEANVMYRHAQEVGAPLEQVMAVMLHVDDQWQSGLSVYRDRRRPFAARERAALQEATPALANAVRNCRLFGAAASWEAATRALLEDRGAAAVLVKAPGVETGRTARAATLIERWFAPHERRPGHLPPPLAEALARATATDAISPTRATWSKPGQDATLVVSFLPLSPGVTGEATWVLLLQETSATIPVPPAWRARLTPREQEVCAAILRGWDNCVVAAELGCAEDTVKRHLLNVFDKLGVSSRAALIARAAVLRSP
ncbi:MAG: Transcriptional regulator, LuxR family protein [Myxococcales bacterium]|nr:Transcriptional regulator, LuxR family protein [Myxococcales bacterium]